ncbi:hypothetical protein AURANDRAFT_20953 [Aureococcus anophagefferens]|uniref:WASH complex subunit 3 n=1 Tax=Aureococcus anophagefferens TaxID=44056 RepID=F0XZM3_AURAN|nr:hypothetical protein AURANDRAFT_20953 [Aureococcus anophagefferens]EGB11593.1 hypothetical protein AURANDRAFT_20953 [Aureococcus anophagefferens]|eukprot:XP_009033944.1 hypothetical protein AURANDRAFT_20953 [Aureococcus anophagefferens]
MADADDMCDKSQLPPVPQVKVVTLVNNFITNTVSFLNVFATSAEEKLSGVAQRISGVELTLALLEAKLNSVPGVADVAPVAPREAPAAAAPAEPPSDALDDGLVDAKDHPDYASFFRLQRLGVPEPQIRMKMVAEGVDPDVIADPERRVPAPPPGGGDDEG